MPDKCFHPSVEGAQHGAKSLAQFLDYAKKSGGKLIVTPIADAQGARMSFRIGFGVRHADQNWKRDLNQFIAQNKPALDKILRDYGVPLLGEDGRPLEAAP